MSKFFNKRRNRNRSSGNASTTAVVDSISPAMGPFGARSAAARPAIESRPSDLADLPDLPDLEPADSEAEGPTGESTTEGDGGKESQMSAEDTAPAEAKQAPTHMGQGSKVTGKLNFEGTVLIDGEVDGEISAEDSVVVGETAVVKAQVIADTVIISGTVNGDVKARRRVEIKAPGKLYGNISTPSLIIHDGVLFEGNCSMGGTDRKGDKMFPLFPSAAEGGKRSGSKLGNGQSEVEW